MSSSWAKPCTHHTVAVLASALATKGRAIAPAAASPADARNIDRLVSLSISPSLVRIDALLRSASIRGSGEYAPPGAAVQLLTTAQALRPAQLLSGPQPRDIRGPDRSSLAELPRFRGGGSRELASGTGPYPLRAPL